MDRFMQCAIEEAKKGLAEGGIPIGSVLVRSGEIVGRGHNMRIQDNDPLAHAEIVCIRNAGRLGNYRDTVLYSTLMPCYLCAGAAVQFGVKKVIVAEAENFKGASDFMREHGIEVTDLNIEECKKMMMHFIRDRPDIWYEDIGK
jgi:cytosine/creatinine deaminase